MDIAKRFQSSPQKHSGGSAAAALGSLAVPRGAESTTFRRSSLSESDSRVSRLKAEIAAREKDDLEIIKGDVCEWLSMTLEIDVSPSGFMDKLDTGVELCKLAELIQSKAKTAKETGEKVKVNIPMERVRCQPNAKKGTFFARDNTANFIKWCKKLGVNEEVMFESNGLVQHQDEKRVILCLIDVSRFAHKVNIRPPELVRLENEIEMLELGLDFEDESVFEELPPENVSSEPGDVKGESSTNSSSPRSSTSELEVTNKDDELPKQSQGMPKQQEDDAVFVKQPLDDTQVEVEEDKERVQASLTDDNKGDSETPKAEPIMTQDEEKTIEQSIPEAEFITTHNEEKTIEPEPTTTQDEEETTEPELSTTQDKEETIEPELTTTQDEEETIEPELTTTQDEEEKIKQSIPEAEFITTQDEEETIEQSIPVNQKTDLVIEKLQLSEVDEVLKDVVELETAKDNDGCVSLKVHCHKGEDMTREDKEAAVEEKEVKKSNNSTNIVRPSNQSPKPNRRGAQSPSNLKAKKTTQKLSPHHSPHRSPRHRSREPESFSRQKKQQPKKVESPAPVVEQKTDELVSCHELDEVHD